MQGQEGIMGNKSLTILQRSMISLLADLHQARESLVSQSAHLRDNDSGGVIGKLPFIHGCLLINLGTAKEVEEALESLINNKLVEQKLSPLFKVYETYFISLTDKGLKYAD
jgi:hypothetical protein